MLRYTFGLSKAEMTILNIILFKPDRLHSANSIRKYVVNITRQKIREYLNTLADAEIIQRVVKDDINDILYNVYYCANLKNPLVKPLIELFRVSNALDYSIGDHIRGADVIFLHGWFVGKKTSTDILVVSRKNVDIDIQSLRKRLPFVPKIKVVTPDLFLFGYLQMSSFYYKMVKEGLLVKCSTSYEFLQKNPSVKRVLKDWEVLLDPVKTTPTYFFKRKIRGKAVLSLSSLKQGLV